MSQKLLNILKYKRPAGSKTEERMISEYIDVLPNVSIDGFGNRIVEIGKGNTTMFSCHTDTVHRDEGMQTVMYDTARGEVFVQGESCLGADDGAGIIIMINLINAGIRGLYVFHREEEIGGFGSSYIAEQTPELLRGIERCIAFDRRGTESVITHQASGRCCSDDFSEALCQELMQGVMVWFPDNTGSFTDSANYTEIIPECTNISCGYDYEHTAYEVLDVEFLSKLIKALFNIKWDDLPTERNPDEVDNDFLYSDYYDDVSINDLETRDDFLEFVYNNPEGAADILMEYKDELDDEYASVLMNGRKYG